MNDFDKFLDFFIHDKIINTVLLILLSIIIYKIITHILTKSESKTKLFSTNKGKTYLRLLKSIIRSIIITVTVLIILQIFGVNISSIIAGVGVFGVVFGLAIQDLLKDIIRGSSILSDEYFEVGDIVKFKDIEGKVLEIGLKTTKIKDLKTSNIISIANRNIEIIEVVSSKIYIKAPLPYELSLSKSEKICNEIEKELKNIEHVNDSKYLGVTELESSYIEYLFEIDCNQNFKYKVRRDGLKVILSTLEKAKISIPYTQIDIHNKK